VEVVAGILVKPDQSFLLASRPEGKVYAGYWEFPGGKVEPGETARAALDRELKEELGVTPTRADPWLVREFSYEHARVRIRFFRVTRWEGTPHPQEGQGVFWHPPGPPVLSPMLPANGPILRALSLPDRYAITAGDLYGEPEALRALDRAIHEGVRLVQIREKTFSPARLMQFGLEVMAHCRPARVRVLVNNDLALVARLNADGVHLSADRLMQLKVRPDLPLVAASCHTREELTRAEALGLDFAVWGPVETTATHPGVPGRGWEAFAAVVHGLSIPVYAIGGMTPLDLPAAREAGAQGIAAIRGLMPLA
jgi:8-oxo-dGTP diphosphatase